MRKGTYILIILMIFFILLSLTVVSFFYFQFAKTPAVKSQSFLELRLMGEIQEKAGPDLMTLFYPPGGHARTNGVIHAINGVLIHH